MKASTCISPGYHFSNNSKKPVQGWKYYPGVYEMENTVGKSLNMKVFNPNLEAEQVTVSFGYVDLNNLAVTASNIVQNIGQRGITNYDIGADPNYATWVANISNPAVSKGIWFSVQVGNPNERVSSGLQFSLQGILGGNHVTFSITRVTAPSITSKSIWELMGSRVSSIAKGQYEIAARTCITGMNFLLQNTSAELYKGGNLFAARLPGNTFDELPTDFDDLVALITSQVHHTLENNHLSTGLSWAYTPEKIQDWLFQEKASKDPYNGNPLNLPYLVILLDASNIGPDTTKSVFVLSGKVMVEYLTTDVSNWFAMSPSSLNMFSALASELSAMNTLSANETHVAHLKRMAKAVATSPQVREAVMSLVQAGIKITPTVLTGIVGVLSAVL
jgi:hypothetical protein